MFRYDIRGSSQSNSLPEVSNKRNNYILDALEGTSEGSLLVKRLELKQGAKWNWGPGSGR